MTWRALAIMGVGTLALLAACQSPSLQSETGIKGDLPNALGLGAFASQCLFLCFVSSSFSQGDTVEAAGVGASSIFEAHRGAKGRGGYAIPVPSTLVPASPSPTGRK
jgi:hypothetical protein